MTVEDGFEATFVVAVPPAEAWASLQVASEAHAEHLRDGQWWLPGFEAPCDELEVHEATSLRVRKAVEPCKGTEIMMTLEQEATGTRITIVQSGFGDWFSSMRGPLEVGWTYIVADLALHLGAGAAGSRHGGDRFAAMRPWSSLGCGLTSTAAGLEVNGDPITGFAAAVGLQPGDVVLTLAGAPIVQRRDLETLMQVFGAGEELSVTWAREGEAHKGAATL